MKMSFREEIDMVKQDLALKLLLALVLIGFIIAIGGIIGMLNPDLLAVAKANAVVNKLGETRDTGVFGALSSFRSTYDKGVIEHTFRNFLTSRTVLLFVAGLGCVAVGGIGYTIRKKMKTGY